MPTFLNEPSIGSKHLSPHVGSIYLEHFKATLTPFLQTTPMTVCKIEAIMKSEYVFQLSPEVSVSFGIS